MEYSILSDIGMKRTANQDFAGTYVNRAGYRLFLLAWLIPPLACCYICIHKLHILCALNIFLRERICIIYINFNY